jgi:hypothetical protein
MKKKIAGLFNEQNLVSAAGVLILAALLVFMGSQSSTRPVLGWTDPTTTPPAANRPTPVLESGNQTRVGDLTINNNLTISDGSAELQVSGTAQITGDATTTGTLTINNKTNACKTVHYSATSGDTYCGSDYWWVAVRDRSGVLVNPSPPPTPDYLMICCKRY